MSRRIDKEIMMDFVVLVKVKFWGFGFWGFGIYIFLRFVEF